MTISETTSIHSARSPLLVSIIINNYNYGRFLRDTIESALDQTCNPVEVIVVDDGSTDDSPSIIAGYGSSVTPVLKKNGGQASAFNAGFTHSHGEVVIFLDADDLLLPDIAERVRVAFEAQPGSAKAQFRLEVVDASGRPTGSVRPPRHHVMPQGDLRSHVLTFPDDIAWQPTSGNAFAANVLQQIFPVPEDMYRICADYYLSNLTALFGPVISLEEVGGYYRVHDTNNHHTQEVDLERTRQIITRTCRTHGYIKVYADSLGLTGFPGEEADVLSVTFLAHRIVSLRVDPQRHPLKDDDLVSLTVRGVKAAFGRFDRSWLFRILYALWFIAAAIAPKPVVRWLARQFFHPETGGGGTSAKLEAPLGRLYRRT